MHKTLYHFHEPSTEAEANGLALVGSVRQRALRRAWRQTLGPYLPDGGPIPLASILGLQEDPLEKQTDRIEELATKVSFRYTGRNENFVLVWRESRGGLQADSAEKLVEIICDALVEPVHCRSFLFSQLAICGEGAQQTGG
jgi:hypothetical protein